MGISTFRRSDVGRRSRRATSYSVRSGCSVRRIIVSTEIEVTFRIRSQWNKNGDLVPYLRRPAMLYETVESVEWARILP
ncbi:hypothetical protein SLE2022_148440 [Rubroshorea leprosula]